MIRVYLGGKLWNWSLTLLIAGTIFFVQNLLPVPQHDIALATESTTQDSEDPEVVEIDVLPDIDLRATAEKYLNNPDLWPIILQLNGLSGIDELSGVTKLRLPVGPLSAATTALRESLKAIQRANEAGAQLFAPVLVSKAIELREKAVVEKQIGKFGESISNAGKSITQAGSAAAESEKKREVGGEARLQDRQGWVEGQKAAESSWSDRPLNSILIEQEKLRTLSQSTAQVVFRDASKLRLNPNSQAVIQQMRVDNLTRREEAKISLVEGDFYALLTPETKRSRLEVSLPNAEATIDSGNFWVSQDKKSAKFSNYDVKPVSITSSGETVVLGRNEGTVVNEGRVPGAKIIVQDSIALVGPEDGMVLYDGKVDLKWAASNQANAYWAELAQDPRFDKMTKSLWGVKENAASEIELSPGTYFWRVAVLDGFGVPGQMSEVRKFEIRSDTNPPFLKLNGPADGSILRKASVEITGETEKEAAVFVNGTKVERDGSASFKFGYEAEPGENVVEVKSVDPAGNETVRQRSFVVTLDQKQEIVFADTVPRDANGTFLSAAETLSLEGQVVANARIQILSQSGDLKSETFTSDDGRFLINIPIDAAGETLVVKVTTASNYAYEEEIEVLVQKDAPTISIIPPIPRYVSSMKYEITVSVDQAANVSINGTLAELKGGRYVVPVDLQEGKNELEIVAVNAVGLSSIERRSLTLDTQLPEVTRKKLAIEKRGNRQFARLQIGAKDATGLAKTSKVIVRSGSQETSGFLRYNRGRKSYQGRVEAPAGDENAAYQVLVELVDVAGNINLVELTQ